MTTLEQHMSNDGIRTRVTHKGTSRWDHGIDRDDWRVTFSGNGRKLTVTFHTGFGLRPAKPTGAEVLSCLIDDAHTIDNAPSFEEWADDLEYDTDSREAERTFREIHKQSGKVRDFLADRWATYCYDSTDVA